MARALMSGLLFGSVTSLFFVPLFFVWLDDMNVWRQRVKLHSRGGPAGIEGDAPLQGQAP
jgi:hypothetical protein